MKKVLSFKTEVKILYSITLFHSLYSFIYGSRHKNQEPGKIAKIYRALVSGIIDNDQVIYRHLFLFSLALCMTDFLLHPPPNQNMKKRNSIMM